MNLYLLPTPIGNLGDISFRILEIIKKVDFLIVEDKRVTKKLLDHYAISKPMVAFHSFNEHEMTEKIILRIKAGEVAAIATDAGTPAISDPGYLLVKACVDNGIKVESLPGPCAAITALVQSGLPCSSFIFEGFLPNKKGRLSKLEVLKEEKRTMIFYESCVKLNKTLLDFSHTFGKRRRISIHRELTKMYEEVLRGKVEDFVQDPKRKWKGEVVIIVEGKPKGG